MSSFEITMLHYYVYIVLTKHNSWPLAVLLTNHNSYLLHSYINLMTLHFCHFDHEEGSS